MRIKQGYKVAFGLALLLGAGMLGTVGAQGMHGMMGGGMHGSGQDGMMQGCPMMGGDSGGMKGKTHGGMKDHGGMDMMRQLDLDEDQHARMRERRSEHRHEQFRRKAEMMDLREEMQALIHSERPDPEAVRELHDRMADLHGDMMADRIRLRNDMHGMLSDEQRKRMRKHMRQ